MAASRQQREALRSEFARSGAGDYTAWLEEHLLAARPPPRAPRGAAETPRQRARREHERRTATEDLAALGEALAAEAEDRR